MTKKTTTTPSPIDDARRLAHAIAATDLEFCRGLPRTIAACKRGGTPEEARAELETVAAYLGQEAPDELSDEDLEVAVGELARERVGAANRRLVWAAQGGDVRATAEELWEALADPNATRPHPAVIMREAGLAFEVRHWRPILDPRDPLFDRRIERSPTREMCATVSEGQVQIPILVTLVGGERREPVVLDGLRRLKAAWIVNLQRLHLWMEAGVAQDFITELPCRLVPAAERFVAIGVANENREANDPLARAHKVDQLVRLGEKTQEQVAALLGIKVRMVGYDLALLKLAPSLQRALSRGALTGPAARVLCQLDGHALQRSAWRAIEDLPSPQWAPALRQILREPDLCEAVKSGKIVQPPQKAMNGELSRCEETGKIFLVRRDSPRVGGVVYLRAPGLGEAEALAQRLDRAPAKVFSKRDKAVARAVLAALQGKPVGKAFSFLLDEGPKRLKPPRMPIKEAS